MSFHVEMARDTLVPGDTWAAHLFDTPSRDRVNPGLSLTVKIVYEYIINKPLHDFRIYYSGNS